MGINSNYLESRLYIGDLIEHKFRVFNTPYAVHNMEYNVFHNCDDRGMPANRTHATMNISIGLGENCIAKPFIEKMKDFDPSAFSLVFGGSVGKDNFLVDFRNVIVFRAYVIDAEEEYSNDGNGQTSTVLNVCLHLYDIDYVSKDRSSVKKLSIIH